MSAQFAKIALFALMPILSACGTTVPGLQELTLETGAEQQLVKAIMTSIHCDIGNAVREFIDTDVRLKQFNRGERLAPWIDNWGAQVTITLAVEENATLNPNAIGLPPSPLTSIFTIAGSASGSATATRTSKSNFFYTVKDLYRRGYCQTGLQPPTGAPSFLIQNDLKVRDWLFDQIAVDATGEGSFPASSSNVFKQNVLSHEVKFRITTGASLTPTWKLTRAIVNPVGPLVSGARERTSDLLITFGPLDPKQDNRSLVQQAENIHYAQQFGLAVSNAVPFSRAAIFQ